MSNLNISIVKDIFPFLLVLFSCSVRSQKLEIDTRMDEYGRCDYFCFGDVKKSDQNQEIDFRANEVNSESINNCFSEYGSYSFYYTTNFFPKSSTDNYTELIKIKYGLENLETNSCIINTEFESRKTKAKRVFTIGQLDEDFLHCKKIKLMDFIPTVGREVDYGKFKKLQEVRTQNEFESFLGYDQKKLYDPLEFKYPGDPFFWSDLLKAEQLESIRFSSKTNHFVGEAPGNLYFLDGFNSDVLLLENINSLSLSGLPYFTVNFFELEKLDFLELQFIQGPELLNLALVLSHFNEKIELQNSIGYLSLIDTSQTINLSENGSFRTEYKNGQTLCEGSFKNGVPHGDWKFWYEDGLLCQERSYDAGQPTGRWTLRGRYNRENLSNGDIITEFTYSNGKLVNRKDIYEGFYGANMQCIQGENLPVTLTTSEYKLFWGDGNNLEIEKKVFSIISEKNRYYTISDQLGDTLTQFSEHWMFDAENWCQTFKEQCNGKITYFEVERKGIFGKEAYYQKVIRQGNSSKSISIINLKDRTWEESEYKKNSSDSLVLIYHVRDTISPQEWSVDIK